MSKIAFLAILSCVGFTVLFAAERSARADGDKLEVRARVSHEALAKRQPKRDPDLEGKKVRLADLRRGAVPNGMADAEKTAQRRGSLVSRSTIISDQSNWTIVPKEAVLYIPSYYQKRVNGERHGKLIGWQEFYARNRSWIKLQEVSLAQASGDDEIDEKVLKGHKIGGRLVVATCNGGPISVKPLKEKPADPTLAAEQEAEKAKKDARDAKVLKELMNRIQSGKR